MCGFLLASRTHISCGEGDVRCEPFQEQSLTSTGPTELPDHNPFLGVSQGPWISCSATVPMRS